MSDQPSKNISAETGSSPTRKWWLALGPALITASVVLGPGSILAASKTGWQFGNQLAWVLAIAVILMLAMTALAARLGVLLDHTPCEEVARRVGRPAAVFVGMTLFLIVACFQFGNNLGVIAAVEPLLPESMQSGEITPLLSVSHGLILALNLLALAALFGSKSLYRPLELLMKVLVGLMVLAFAANLLLVRPNLLEVFKGLWPSLPQHADGKAVDYVPALALIATTFSLAGAFYQAYLVRQKGWTPRDLKAGFIDSAFGIAMLGGITLMIMITAASTLSGTLPDGTPKVAELKSTADVALALRPLFGPAAVALFCLGIFAGAFSSLLVNAMIGGTLLADGCGLGGDINRGGPRWLTAVALLTGLLIALAVRMTGKEPVALIFFAQALTVLGMPILAITLVWLATRKEVLRRGGTPLWILGLAIAGTLVAMVLAGSKAVDLCRQVLEWRENSR